MTDEKKSNLSNCKCYISRYPAVAGPIIIPPEPISEPEPDNSGAVLNNLVLTLMGLLLLVPHGIMQKQTAAAADRY